MTSSLGAGLLWFVLILVAIPVVLWLLKRTPYGAAMSGAGAGVAATRTVSSVSLGQHQRVVTIEVGQGDEKRWLVLGVTPQSITTLHTLSAQPEPVAAAVAPMPFSALLNKVIHARR